ncbi:MAG: hypothetical protein H5U11_13725 [Rhizobium sp.]|nr:hypothetical protein [Rhizobium sp.]
MGISQHTEWPDELAFMLRDLRPVQLVSLIRTEMDAGNIKTRHRFTPKDGWTGEARFDRAQRQLMESLIGKTCLAQLPHRNELSLITLLHDRAAYPGYGPEIIQETRNSDGSDFWVIRYHFWDQGPYGTRGSDPLGGEAL